jgi:hypothetical protein
MREHISTVRHRLLQFKKPPARLSWRDALGSVIKICGNPRTVRTMKEHIDVAVTGLLRRPPPMAALPPPKCSATASSC